MKLIWYIISLLLTPVAAFTQQETLQLALSMPKCGFDCLQTTLAASPCSPLDSSCSCSNATITEQTTACVAVACTIKEQLTTKNLTEQICGRPPRRGSNSSTTAIVGIGFAVLAYALRMTSKISFPCEKGARIDANFWWDDALITFALALLVAIAVLSDILIRLGIGKDIWNVPFDNLTKILKLYYADELLYLTALPVIKVSLLCTYLRIFQSTRFRKFVYGAIVFNVVCWLVFYLISALQCTPVSLAWNRWSGEHPGTCRNINAQSWAAATVNIFLDFVVIGLPMPELWKMNLNKRKKALVCLMFGVGFFATAVSILRLQILVKFGDSQNLTHDYKSVGYWSLVELFTSIICACMPGIRNLIRKAFPRLMGSTYQSTGAATPAISGRTPGNSALEKSVPDVVVRPRASDEGHFIPLQDFRVDTRTDDQRSHVSRPSDHQRNFSHPYSFSKNAWLTDSEEDVDPHHRAVSPV